MNNVRVYVCISDVKERCRTVISDFRQRKDKSISTKNDEKKKGRL